MNFLKELEKNGGKYNEWCAKIACIAGIFAWLFSGLLLNNILAGLLAGIVFGVIAFLFAIVAPAAKRKRHAAEVEARLPYSLMAIAACLNMNIGLEKCIENVTRGDDVLSAELGKALWEHRQLGFPLQECLFRFSERNGRLDVKRCIMQLCNVLEQGGKASRGEGVKMIAKEMLYRQRSESREFSGKLAFLALVFIAVSAIIPAIFQSIVIVGSMVLNISLSPVQVLGIIALLFPAIDIAVLLYVREKNPVFMRD